MHLYVEFAINIKLLMRLFWFAIISLLCIELTAQTNNNIILSKRTVYIELWGAASPISVNYDSRFNEDSRLGYRFGLNYVADLHEFTIYDDLSIDEISGINIPLEINYLVGRKGTKSKFELGVGVNLGFHKKKTGYYDDWDKEKETIISNKNMVGYFVFTNIGYRLQPKKGFLFRVGITPIFDFGGKGSIAKYMNISMFIPSVSLGYAF